MDTKVRDKSLHNHQYLIEMITAETMYQGVIPGVCTGASKKLVYFSKLLHVAVFTNISTAAPSRFPGRIFRSTASVGQNKNRVFPSYTKPSESQIKLRRDGSAKL